MKKLSKKLKLNKETISALTNEQMNDVKGGSSPACVIAGVGIVVGIHELGDNQSWWHCSADSAACASNGIGC